MLAVYPSNINNNTGRMMNELLTTTTTMASVFDERTKCSCTCNKCNCSNIIDNCFSDKNDSLIGKEEDVAVFACSCSSSSTNNNGNATGSSEQSSCCSGSTTGSDNKNKASCCSKDDNDINNNNNNKGKGGCFMKQMKQIYHFEIVLSFRKVNQGFSDDNDEHSELKEEEEENYSSSYINDIISQLSKQTFISMVERQDRKELELYVSGHSLTLFEVLKSLFEHPNIRKLFRVKLAKTMSVLRLKLDPITSKMKCMGCSSKIEKEFNDYRNVIRHIYCDLEDQTVTFFFEQQNSKDQDVRSLILDIMSNDLKKKFQVLNTSFYNVDNRQDDDKKMIDVSQQEEEKEGIVVLNVDGMKCGKCVKRVKEVLNVKFGLLEENIQIDLNEKRLTLKGISNKNTETTQFIQDVIQEIKGLGYSCTIYEEKKFKEYQLTVTGMKCNGCKKKITELLEKDEHVKSVNVDLENKQVSISCDYKDPSILIENIEKLGFSCERNIESYSFKSEPLVNYQKEKLIGEEIDSLSTTATTTLKKKKNLFKKKNNGYETLTEIELDEFNESLDKEQYHPVTIDINDNTIYDQHSDNGISSSGMKKKAIISIEGMSCASCVGKIEKTLKSLQGVEKCVVNLIMEKGEVIYDENLISENDLIKKVTNLGYNCKSLTEQVEKNKLKLSIDANHQSFFLDILSNKAKGIIDFEMTREEGMDDKVIILTISFDIKVTNARKIFELLNHEADLNNIPSQVSIVKSSMLKNKLETLQRKKEIRKWLFMFLFSLLFTVPAMLISMVFGNINSTKMGLMKEVVPGLSIMSLVMFLLVSPVQFICGIPFYILSFKAIRSFSLDMNVLIAIATTEAYGYSLFTSIYNIVAGKMVISHDYFETAAALIMFLSLGRLLESYAKGNTSGALVALLNLQPSMAILVDDNNNEREIDVDLVQEGDIIKVIRGSKVPVDGVITNVDGVALVDEQMITGESMPVSKHVDSEVIGGTVNVGDTYFFMKATRVGSDSTLSGIAKLVEQAQSDKPKIQGLADKISAWFVPGVIILSILVFGVWALLGGLDLYPKEWRPDGMNPYLFALLLSTSTVIIACPCALGLAVPTAVMVGTGIGAKNGILIKGGSPIEIAKQSTAVTFDKTGTLTKGELVVEHFERFGDNNNTISNDYLLSLVAIAESGSEHTIGKALVRYCNKNIQDNNLITKLSSTMTEFNAVSGRGLSCKIGNYSVDIGNEQYMEEKGCKTFSKVDTSQFHQTLVFVAIDNQIISLFGLSDEIREESEYVVKELMKRGLKVFMLTGDNNNAALHVGRCLGIPEENIFSQLTPSGKTNKIKELQQKGEKVVMLGDGINDSVSLVQADLGVSIGQGTDIAIECAQIILMKSDLRGLLSSIRLCRTIYWRIVMNFIWAFGYNAIAIPFAAGVFFPLMKFMIPPWVAGICMSLSSVCVLLSSLSLKLQNFTQ